MSQIQLAIGETNIFMVKIETSKINNAWRFRGMKFVSDVVLERSTTWGFVFQKYLRFESRKGAGLVSDLVGN